MPRHFVEPEELQAFLDHELVPTRQEEVGRHVKDCQECSAVIADLQNVSATLRQWGVEPAPPNLRPPVLVVERPPRRWSWTRFALGLGASAAVVLLIAAISIPNLLRSRIATNQPSPPIAYEDSPRGLFSTLSDRDEAKDKADLDRLPQDRLIAYEVRLMIEVKEFEAAKSKLRQIMDAEGGYITSSDFVETPNQAKRAVLVLRIPAVKLATILTQARELGRVKEEHMNSEEVTEQVVDLEARLKNARSTEQRLIDVLNNRTGKVADVLQVEQEISRAREQIERMEAQRQNLMRRVEMATVSLTLAEEFKAQLEPTPVGTGRQLWNALVDGYEGFVGTILGIILFVARYGLSLAFWGGLLWLGWRMVRRPLKRLLAQAG